MSDFVLLLLTAGFTAYACAATLGCGGARWARLLAVLGFVAAGANTALYFWWSGDGRLFPGWQVSPEVRNFFQHEYVARGWPTPDPGLCLVALAAHFFALLPRATRGAWLRPLPATLFFVVVFFATSGREPPPIRYARAQGPGLNAYLTIAPRDGGATLILARGPADGPFVRVLAVHEARSEPPEPPRLLWTADGRGIVLAVYHQRIYALDRDTRQATGFLPVHANEWPGRGPADSTRAIRRRLSQARRDVAEFVARHGGYFVR